MTSGTATLETAVIGTPQVVCYRMGGSKILYDFYKMLLKVRFVSLPNLIVDAPVVKELLMHHCSVENVAAELRALLPDSEARRSMLQGYAEMNARLGDNDCAAVAAAGIVAHLKKQ